MDYISIGILFTICFGASFLLFYQFFLKKLGGRIAELVTTNSIEKIKTKYSKVLEDYKKDLTKYLQQHKADLDLELEPIKTLLSKGNITHQIQLGYIYQKRVDETLVLYKNLREVDTAIRDWTVSIKPILEDLEKEEYERRKRVDEALNEFIKHYYSSKLLYPKDAINHIEKLFEEYRKITHDYGFSLNSFNPQQDNETVKEIAGKMQTTMHDQLLLLEEVLREKIFRNEVI